jgi:hypothetical protein
MNGKKLLIWMGGSVAACAAAVIFYERSPPNTFNPLCTYNLAYRLTVTLEIGGKQYTSEAVNQLTRPAHWVGGINGRGCPQLRGTALSFRLADNRLILLTTWICNTAFSTFGTIDRDGDGVGYREAMRVHRKVNIAAKCVGIRRSYTYNAGGPFDGFLINDADKPATWRGFFFHKSNVATLNADEDVRIISAVAEADDVAPEDQLDTVAPAVLKTRFLSPISDTPDYLLPERKVEPQFVASKDPLSDADRLRLQTEAKEEARALGLIH